MTRRLTQWTAATTLLFAAANACVYAQPAATPAAPAPESTTPPAQPAPQPPPPQVQPGPNMPSPPMMGPGRPMMMPPGGMRPMMPPPPPPPQPVKPAKHLVGPPGVAATVDGVVIKTADVQQLAMQAAGAQVVDQLITAQVIDQQAKKSHALPTDAQVAAKIAELRRQIAAQYQGQTLEQILQQRGITMTRVKTIIRTQIEVQNLVGQNVKSIPMVHVRHILIRTKNPNNDPSAKVHTDAEARDIIAKIQADLKAGKSFEDEAKQYTEDPSGKQNGGDLPVVNATTPFDQNFLKAAMALKKGEVTPQPVDSIFGLHLIYCVSTSDDSTPADKKLFDDAETQYREQQVSMTAQTYVQTLKTKAKVVNYISP